MPSDTPPATPEHAVGGGGSKVCITALYAKPSPVNPGPARWRLQGVCQELCAKHIPSHKPWSCSSTLALVILRIGPSPAHEPCVVIWHPSLPLKLAHMPGPEHRTCSSSPAAHSPLYPPLPPRPPLGVYLGPAHQEQGGGVEAAGPAGVSQGGCYCCCYPGGWGGRGGGGGSRLRGGGGRYYHYLGLGRERGPFSRR